MTILTIFIFLLILILLLIISLIIINSTQFSHKIGGYRGGGDSDDENDTHLISAIERANSVIASPHKLSPQPPPRPTANKLIEKKIIKNNEQISNLESEQISNLESEQISNLESELSYSEDLQNTFKYQIEELNTKIEELNTEIEKNKQIIEAFTTNAETNNSNSTSNRDTILNLKRGNEALLESMKILKADKEKITYFLQASLESINNINSKLKISNSAKQDMVKKIENALEASNYY